MKIRYHIVPKVKPETAMLIEANDTMIKVKNVLSSEETFKALHGKLDAWYKKKNVQVERVELNEKSSFAYHWVSEPIHDHTFEEYHLAGGCDISDLISELETQYRKGIQTKNREEKATGKRTIEYPNIMNEDVDNFSSSLDEAFFPFATSADKPISMYEEPVCCDYEPAKGTVPVNSGEGNFLYKGKHRRKFKHDVTDPGMILGPRIEGDPLPIASINEEMNNAIFEGIFVSLALIKTKTEKGLIKGSVVDGTNSIQFVKFVDNYEDAETLLTTMKKVKGVRVQGDVSYDDKFEKDYIFNLRSIQELKKATKRAENREDSRVELHLHTKMSDRDALVNVKELLQTIKEWGHPAVAITDHGVIQAFPEAQDIAAKLGVKVIYGVEGYLIEDEETDTRSHIILLAKNTVGLRNLYKMITISHLQYYKRRPRLPRAVIEDHREGIIVGSACEAGELIRAIVKGESQDRLLEIASFYDYLEIQPLENNRFLLYDRKTGEQIREENFLVDINKKVVELGDLLNKPVVATCDVHHLNDDEKIYRQIMLTVSGFKDIERTPSLYLRTTDEMLEEFKYLGTEKAYEVVVTNSRMINDSIESLQPVPQGKTYSPKIEGADKALTEMCYKKAKEIYGDPLPSVVANRLDYELTRIIGNGYGVLYYIAHKLVRKSLDDGYLVGSRGSVGSSFVATMADITEVNPLPPHYVCPNCKNSKFFEKGEYAGGFDLPRKNCPKCGTPLNTNGHDIPFAIFMGFNGDKVPDIDLNFSGDYQPRAHKYTEELFGRDNVFRAGTIGTIAEKTAIGYVKKYAEAQDIQARQGFLEALAKGVTGVKNTTGQHPGGIMVCPRDMDVHQFTPVQYPANKKDSGIITTHFDYHSFEGCMTKLDILGHDDPTIIRMLEDITGVDVQTIPFDDPDTLSLFSSTKAIGLTPEQLLGDKVASLAVPECGTGFVRRMLEDSKPQHFSDIVRISGFSHGTNVWLDNAQTLIKNGTCKLNEAISTRDDIMNFLMHRDIEPLTCFKVMENVRKGKGIDKLNKVGEKETDYEEQMRAGGIPDWFIDSCKKISYLFPRAHAVAYVMMAFRIAWFKINYPLAFYAAYFSIRAKAYDMKIMASSLEVQRAEFERLKALDRKASNKDKDMMSALEVSMEMKQRGFNFLVADLNHSESRRFKIHEGALLPPFIAVDSLGEKVADAIVAEREKNPFTSVKDVQRRCKISESILATMRELGCFADLPEDEQMSLFG